MTKLEYLLMYQKADLKKQQLENAVRSTESRQKLNKVVVTLSLQEDYQVNDSNCYRIHRLEQELYGDYIPEHCECDDMITYEWNESRDKNLYGHFNFYFGISRDAISKSSMLLYMMLLFLVSLLGNVLWTLLSPLRGM